MSSACSILSPRPAALTGPISIISADNYLGLQSDHGEDGSGRSIREEFVDTENGDGHRWILERNEARIDSEAGGNEASHLPLRDLTSDGRPKLIQRSKAPNQRSCDNL